VAEKGWGEGNGMKENQVMNDNKVGKSGRTPQRAQRVPSLHTQRDEEGEFELAREGTWGDATYAMRRHIYDTIRNF
jgi:hypothetical protein